MVYLGSNRTFHRIYLKKYIKPRHLYQMVNQPMAFGSRKKILLIFSMNKFVLVIQIVKRVDEISLFSIRQWFRDFKEI